MAEMTVTISGDNNAQRAFRQVQDDINQTDRAQRRFSGRALSDTARLRAEYLATGVAIGVVTTGFANFLRDTVNVASTFESISASLTSLGENGEVVASRLRDIAREQDGLTFENLARGVIALQVAGLETERAAQLLAGYSRGLAAANVSLEDQRRFVVQLTQAYAGNVAEGNDLRTLVEVYPKLINDVSAALGVQLRTWKDLSGALDDTGVSLRRALELGSEVASQTVIDPNQFRVQQERLTEAVQDLQRVLGEQLLPVLTSATRGITGFINSVSADIGGVLRFTAGTIALSTAFSVLIPLVTQATRNMLSFARFMGSVFELRLLGATVVLDNLVTALRANFIAGITSAITALRNFRIALAVAIPVIGAFTLAVGAIAVAMRNSEDAISSFDEALNQIGAGLRFDEGLGRVRTFADFTDRELREGVNRLITERSRIEDELVRIHAAFRDVFGADRVNSVRQVLDEFGREGVTAGFGREFFDVAQRAVTQFDIIQAHIDNLNREIQSRTTQATRQAADSFSRLRTQIVEASFAVSRLQDAFGDTEGLREARAIADDLRSALRLQAALRISQAQGIEDAERRDAERVRLREQLRDDLLDVERSLTEREQGIFQRQTELRLAAAERRREGEVEGYRLSAEAGEAYAQILRTIATISGRREFDTLVRRLHAQGAAWADAVSQALRFLPIMRAMSDEMSAADRYFRSFERTLTLVRNGINQALGPVQALVEGVRQLAGLLGERFPDTAGSLEQSIFNEQEAFSDLQPGAQSPLERDRIQARTEGLAFIRRIFRANLRDEEADLEESLNRQFQQYEKAYRRIGDVAVDALFGRIQNIREFALGLIEEIVRGLLRVEISERITAARTLAIDTAVTNARIANQERLQAAIANSQNIQLQSAAGGLPIGNLPGLGSGSLTGGLGALSVAGLLFPNEFSNLGQGIGQIFSRAARAVTQSDGNINVDIGDIRFLFDDGTSRKVSNRRTLNVRRRR